MRTARLGSFMLVLALGLAPIGALAAPAAHHLFGTITSASAGSIVVTDRQGKAVTVKTAAATKIVGMTAGKAADIKVGDTVQIVADKAQDETLTALAVRDVPAGLSLPGPGRGGERPARGGKTLVSGTVAQVRGTTLSVTAAGGTATSVTLAQDVRVSRVTILPATNLVTGAHVMVTGTDNPDGTVTAAYILVMPKRPR